MRKSLFCNRWVNCRFAILLAIVAVFTATVQAQDVFSDSLKQIIAQEVDLEVKDQLEWLYWLFGVSVGGLFILGIYLWIWRIKKVTDKLIAEKVDRLVEEMISEKTGVKTEILRAILQEQASQKEVKQKRIIVLSKDKGRKKELAEKLLSAGFKDLIFLGQEELDQLDTNGVALILINNDKEKEQFQEEELTALFDDLRHQVRLAYLGPQVGTNMFNKYKSIVKFTNVESYLITNLTEALRH